MWTPYALLFQVISLQIIVSKKMHLHFFITYHLYGTFKFTVTSSSAIFLKQYFNKLAKYYQDTLQK